MKQAFNVIVMIVAFLSSISSLQAQECTCNESFEATVETYEKNYALFSYKVTEDNLAIYNAHTDVMREKAQQTESLKECKQVLEQWLSFFRDKHNYINLAIKDNQAFEHIQVNEQRFKEDYHKLGYHEDDLSGIWKWREHTIAIMPAPQPDKRERDFVGVLLESTINAWKPTAVVLELIKRPGGELETSFFMPDHTEIILQGKKINAGQLQFKVLGEWQKSWPVVEIDENSKLFNTFHIRMIDDVPYVRFPDFNTKDPHFVDSLLSAHHEQLVNAEFIVVDIRDNGGGNDNTYFPMLPYMLSGPIEIPHVGFWMSEDNLLAHSGIKKKNIEELTPEKKEEYDYWMALKGTVYYDKPGVYAYTYAADTLYKGPKKVAVLMNENSGSSAETFIFRGKQSERVVFYGQNSGGFVDGFMGLSKNIGCFELSYPSAMRANDLGDNPIDPYGLEPDVYLDKNVDVLEFSIRHMKQLIKNEEH